MSYFIIMFLLLIFLYAYHKRTGSFPFSTGQKEFDIGLNVMLILFWCVTVPTLILIIGGLGIVYTVAMIYYAIKDKIKGVKFND